MAIRACGRDLIRLPFGQPPSPKGKVCLMKTERKFWVLGGQGLI